MTDVFISYSRKDIARAKSLAQRLEQNGLTVWIDLEDIAPAADWMLTIRSAIDECRAFVFLISRDSIESNVCRQELNHALENGKKVVPVCIKAIDVADAPAELAALHWIDAVDATHLDSAVKDIAEATESDPAWTTLHAHLTVRAREWKEHGSGGSRLLRGDELATAETALTAHRPAGQPQSSELQRAFVQHSRKAATSRLRMIAAAIALAVVATSFAAVFAFIQRDRAQFQARIATSRSLAASARVEMTNQFDLAMLLAVAAHEIEPTPEAYGSLVSVLARYSDLEGVRRDIGSGAMELRVRDEELISVSPRMIQTRNADTLSLVRSHLLEPMLKDNETGAWLFVSRDADIAIFSATDPATALSRIAAVNLGSDEVLWEQTAPDYIDLIPDPDGLSVIVRDSLAYDAKPGLVDLATGVTRELATAAGLTGSGSYAHATDGALLYLDGGTDDGVEVRVIDPSTYRTVRTIKPVVGANPSFGAEQQLWVNKIAYHPPTQRIAIGLSDGTVSVANRSDPFAEGSGGPAHSSNLTDLQFSASGNFLASVAEDGSLAIWSLVDRIHLLDQRDSVNGWRATSVAFSPDETRLHVATEQGLVTRSTMPGPGLLGEIVSVAQNHWVSPDAGFFARNSASESDTIEIVDSSTLDVVKQIRGIPGYPSRVSFDGPNLILVAKKDNVLHVGRMSLDGGGEIAWDRFDSEDVNSPVVSPGGDLIAVAGRGLTLLDSRTGERKSDFYFEEAWSAKHAFSPQGTWIAVMTEGHFGDELYLWPTTATTGGRDSASTLYPVRGWTFDQAQNRLVVSRSDGVDLYSLADGLERGQPAQLSAASDVEILGFADDESLLIGLGKFLHVWNLASGQPIADPWVVTWPGSGCYWRELSGTCELGYSGDAKTIAVVVPNNPHLPSAYSRGVTLAQYTTPSILILWDLHSERLKSTACRIADRELAPEEWLRFAPDLDAFDVCRGQ